MSDKVISQLRQAIHYIRYFTFPYLRTRPDPRFRPSPHRDFRIPRSRRQNRPKNRCFFVPRLSRKHSHNRSQRLFRTVLSVPLSLPQNRSVLHPKLHTVSNRVRSCSRSVRSRIVSVSYCCAADNPCVPFWTPERCSCNKVPGRFLMPSIRLQRFTKTIFLKMAPTTARPLAALFLSINQIQTDSFILI